ncbi:conserved hypothetical protein [Leishmania mexicana MHOM/GT/2001/U1103]|uniref:Uncharacterized protein n=1 Tax=Leishmania mexicana (strain MHOM/GT/2001/U1103) TaxID=929439 RepID=E9AZ63_LEIMU|nr:conserved hypothetical protein [Leishmania mexicana MHOM/GT/2001/U1103]CBZ28260.1 conserved hypothetical protein [Leishmania mexicana MHOM/GT/2001/U1103]
MAASACSSAVNLHNFRLLATGNDTASAAPSSAPLTAPLSFSLTFHFQRYDGADFESFITSLGVSVDFVADVASEKTTLTLLPLTPVSGPLARPDSTTANGAFLMAASASDLSTSSSDYAAGAPVDGAAGAAPGVMYQLRVYLSDFRPLEAVQLKHLLQVSMMRVRLARLGTGDDVANSDMRDPRTEERSVAAWNVIWRVRRNPQNEQELIRTVLDPLA